MPNPKPRSIRVAGMSENQILELLTKEPGPVALGSPELESYRARPARLSGVAYDTWVARLTQQKPEDTE